MRTRRRNRKTFSKLLDGNVFIPSFSWGTAVYLNCNYSLRRNLIHRFVPIDCFVPVKPQLDMPPFTPDDISVPTIVIDVLGQFIQIRALKYHTPTRLIVQSAPILATHVRLIADYLMMVWNTLSPKLNASVSPLTN